MPHVRTIEALARQLIFPQPLPARPPCPSCSVTYNAGPFLKLPLASVALAQAHNLFATLIRQLSPSPYKKRAGSYFCGNGAR